MIADLSNAQAGSIVLLHTCAHNPTGVDPTPEEWKRISDACKKQNLYPFFDTAYQGFASGDLDKDGYGLRFFIQEGHQLLVCQSFAKVMGLYGERTGAMHVVCHDKDTAAKVLSQVKIIIRTDYSSPPRHGARIAAKILSEKGNRDQWLKELVAVTDRMNQMRAALRASLEKNGAKGKWDHITT
jgi:aspartate aminotransferase